MAILSAFADEIDPDPRIQTEVLAANGISHVDLRGAWGTNVMKFTDQQRADAKAIFDDAGVTIACIGSPIGKVTVDADLDAHFDEFKHAVDLAGYFDCKFIRIFSYYPPEGGNVNDHRDVVVERLDQMCRHLAGSDIVLALENEADIFGDAPANCLDLMQALASHSANLTMAFDPANFVVKGHLPVYETCWQPLAQYVGFFHMKDAEKLGGPNCPCGQGLGDFPKILADVAKNPTQRACVFTMEPHLKSAGQFAGNTGPELFNVAVDAVKKLFADTGIAAEA